MDTNPSERSSADLPMDLLSRIAKSLKTRIDVTRFRSVCNSWRCSTPDFNKTLRFPPGARLPYLVDPSATNPERPAGHLLLIEKTYYFLWPLHEPSPEPASMLIAVEEHEGGKVQLLNPITFKPIEVLPEKFPTVLNLNNFRVSELNKVYEMKFVATDSYRRENDITTRIQEVLLLNPMSEDSVLFVLLSGRIAYLRSLSEEWMLLGDKTDDQGKLRDSVNIANYNGQV